MKPNRQHPSQKGQPPRILALAVGAGCVLVLFAVLVVSLLLQKPPVTPVIDISLASIASKTPRQEEESDPEPFRAPSVPPPPDRTPPPPDLDINLPPPPVPQNPMVFLEPDRAPLDIRIPEAPKPPPKVKPRPTPVPKPPPKRIQRPLFKPPPTPTPRRAVPKVVEKPRPRAIPKPAPPVQTAPQIYSTNQLDRIPQLKSGNIRGTTFPRSLSRKGIKRGRATLLVEIDTRGRAKVMAINSISHPELKPMAIQSVRRARFTVPTKNGRPVRARFQWTLTLQQ